MSELANPWTAMHEMILFVEAHKELFDKWDRHSTPDESAFAIGALHRWIHEESALYILATSASEDITPIKIPANQFADFLDRLVADAKNYSPEPESVSEPPTGMYL